MVTANASLRSRASAIMDGAKYNIVAPINAAPSTIFNMVITLMPQETRATV